MLYKTHVVCHPSIWRATGVLVLGPTLLKHTSQLIKVPVEQLIFYNVVVLEQGWSKSLHPQQLESPGGWLTTRQHYIYNQIL